MNSNKSSQAASNSERRQALDSRGHKVARIGLGLAATFATVGAAQSVPSVRHEVSTIAARLDGKNLYPNIADQEHKLVYAAPGNPGETDYDIAVSVTPKGASIQEAQGEITEANGNNITSGQAVIVPINSTEGTVQPSIGK